MNVLLLFQSILLQVEGIGWSIHIWKGVIIEAEFHCVWQSPEGKIIDITPKDYEVENIIFLPDPSKCYTGRQVDNIRKSLSTDSNVTEFISITQEYFRYLNKGDLADYYGEITIKEDFINRYNLMQELELLLKRKHGENRGISTGGHFVNYRYHTSKPIF